MRALLLLLGLILAGCGSQVASANPEVSNTTTEASTTTGEPVQVDDEPGNITSIGPVDDGGLTLNEFTEETTPTTAGEHSSDDDTESEQGSASEDGSSTTTEATTTSTTSTTTTVPDSELDLLITELASYVEQERGLEFKTRPQVQLLNEAEFAQAWLDLIDEDVRENGADFANFTDIYQTMGIISDDMTLQQIWTRFGEAGVLGYYETDIEAIRLRNGDINALTRTTLVHELVHALEDQHFDLSRDEYDDRDDEISWAFSALIEGSARVIENRYRDTYSAAELAEERDAVNAIPRSVSFSEFSASFLELQFGRYNYGEVLAETLWSQGGQAAIDAAFASPPSSSEQVLEPVAFARGSAPDAALPAPPAGGVVFEQGVWGEAAWAALLSDSAPLGDSLRAADGWGGDWYVAWRDGSQTCVRIDVSADTAVELSELENAIERWVGVQSGRRLEAVGPDILRITVCE